jgi:hypothetical protein
MADEGPTAVWMVGEPDYDSCSHHAVFTSRADADAYAALNTDWHVEEMPLYRSGTMPAIVEAWSATAAVRRHRTTAMTSSTLGHTSMTVYDNEPPTLRCYRFSELEALPIWAKRPCDVTRCDLERRRADHPVPGVGPGCRAGGVPAAVRGRTGRDGGAALTHGVLASAGQCWSSRECRTPGVASAEIAPATCDRPGAGRR